MTLLLLALCLAPPDLGLAADDLPDGGGVKVTALTADSPLRKVVRRPEGRTYRLEPGDVITHLTGQPVTTLAELTGKAAAAGPTFTLTVLDVRTKGVLLFEVTPAASPAGGPKVHAVLVADTDDGSIGKSCQADLKTVRSLLAGGVYVHKSRVGTVTTLSGSQASADGVLRAIAALPSRPQDTVLVYASCHGAFDAKLKDPASGGHYLALKRVGGKDLTRADLRKALADRPARTRLLVTDACNTPKKITLEPQQVPTELIQRPKELTTVEKLLFAHAGRLDVNAASGGESAMGVEPEGGLFTLALTVAMTRSAAWPEVLKTTDAEARRGMKGHTQSVKVFENSLKANEPAGLTPLLNGPDPRKLPYWWGK